jgi:hypothetical protein
MVCGGWIMMVRKSYESLGAEAQQYMPLES